MLAGETAPVSVQVRGPGGSWVWLAGSASPVRHEGAPHVVVVARDVTERRRAEAEHGAHLHFLESLDRMNRAMQGTSDLEQMMSDVHAAGPGPEDPRRYRPNQPRELTPSPAVSSETI